MNLCVAWAELCRCPRVLNPLKLELLVVVSQQVDAWNQIWFSEKAVSALNH